MGYEFTVYKGTTDGGIVKTIAHRDELKGDEVLVEVTHSGVCGTDAIFKATDMGLGHEGVGIVKSTGPDVKMFKLGDRVGWGYEFDSCGHCDECLTGREQYCPDREIYISHYSHQGSMSSHAVWREGFLFKIPETLKSEDAAPLMCGGATVFNALNAHDVKAYHKVGVIGVGGLGHLAIQFAAKMGCEVIVFSTTTSKKQEALNFGAKEFYTVSDLKNIDPTKIPSIDHLIVTSNTAPDWNLFLPIMARGGTIYPVTVTTDKLDISIFSLLTFGLKVQGTFITSKFLMRKMLDFAAFHGIKPTLQTFPMNVNGIAEAFKALSNNTMRYRGVLVAEK